MKRKPWRIGETRVFQQWPKNKPLPPNAIPSDGPVIHHDHWSTLIELVDVPNEEPHDPS